MNTVRRKNSPRRPVVGVMTGSFHTDYSRQIAEAICSRLENEDVDICLFQGLDASRFLNIDGYVDKGFDDHYYSQFEYSRFIRPDLLIVSLSTISAVSNPLSVEKFCRLMPDVPLIVLEVQAEVPNGIYLTLDNYRGMCDCVEHLIGVHGYRDILYISGPKSVADAKLRLSAFCDVMERHGLPVSDDTIYYGDFTDRIDPLVERLLKDHPRPEAIVCGNDEMAESVYRVLRLHGLNPGADVAVTGFDDNAADAFMDPPLTSVRQSQDALADKTLEAVRAYLRGETPSSAILPAQLICRQSCGCAAENLSAADPHIARHTRRTMEDRRRIKQLSYDSIVTSLMLRNLLDENITVHTFFRRLGELLHTLGAEYSWVALLDEPATIVEGERLRLPDELRLHMVQDGASVRSWSRKEAPVLTAGEPPKPDAPFRVPDGTASVFPLFYGNKHYGVFVVKLSREDVLFYYTLSLELGTGLRYLFMALDQQEARAALEEKNQILDFSASHDSLTGLYNRAGVMNHVYDYVRTHGQDRRYVAVAADLDHLKQINDSFGHNLGDLAIRKAAEILRGILPEDAPLGRIGGDEFMAIFLGEEEDAPEKFFRQVKEACQAYNSRNEAPFYEEISVGCCAFDSRKGADFIQVFKQADQLLYEDKKHRRKNVIRIK